MAINTYLSAVTFKLPSYLASLDQILLLKTFYSLLLPYEFPLY